MNNEPPNTSDENLNLRGLADDVKEYFNIRLRLNTLMLVEKGAKLLSTGITGSIALAFVLLCFVFLSLSFAFYVSSVLGSTSLGFFMVSMLYLFIGLLVFALRRRFDKSLIDKFIKAFLGEGDKDE